MAQLPLLELLKGLSPGARGVIVPPSPLIQQPPGLVLPPGVQAPPRIPPGTITIEQAREALARQAAGRAATPPPIPAENVVDRFSQSAPQAQPQAQAGGGGLRGAREGFNASRAARAAAPPATGLKGLFTNPRMAGPISRFLGPLGIPFALEYGTGLALEGAGNYLGMGEEETSYMADNPLEFFALGAAESAAKKGVAPWLRDWFGLDREDLGSWADLALGLPPELTENVSIFEGRAPVQGRGDRAVPREGMTDTVLRALGQGGSDYIPGANLVDSGTTALGVGDSPDAGTGAQEAGVPAARRGGGGGGGSLRRPFVPFEELNVDIPQRPDLSGLLERYRALTPPAPREINPWEYFLSGLAQGGLSAGENPTGSSILYRAGLGALAGRGQYQTAERQQADQQAQAIRQHQLQSLSLEGDIAGDDYRNALAALGPQVQIAGYNQQGREREAAQLAPQVSGNTILSNRRVGDEVVSNISQLPSTADNRLQLMMALYAQQATRDPKLVFNAIVSAAPDVVKQALQATGVGTANLSSGKDFSPLEKAVVMQWITQNQPELLEQVAPQIQMQGALKALGGR